MALFTYAGMDGGTSGKLVIELINPGELESFTIENMSAGYNRLYIHTHV